MAKTISEEIVKEAEEYEITQKDNIGSIIEDGWIPNLLDDIGMADQTHIYIRKVGDHIEIGVAQVNFIR